MEFVNRNIIEKLLQDLRIVYKSRFAAERRLKKHDALSQWTVILVSLQLILIPLLTTTGLMSSNRIVDVVSIFLAVFILVFSVLITSEKFLLRAESNLKCGMRLNYLRRIIESNNIDMISADLYKSYIKDYNEILGDYENHQDADFYSQILDSDQRKVGVLRSMTTNAYFRVKWDRAMEFAKYYLTVTLSIAALLYLIFRYGPLN